MEDNIRHITNAILFDEEQSLQGDREIRDISVQGDVVHVTIAVESRNRAESRRAMEDEIRAAIGRWHEGKTVRITSVAMDEVDVPCAHHHDAHKDAAHEPLTKKAIPGVRHVYLVCSAKGGVGKSTVALNTALALSSLGKKVALLDLDLYGPSIPSLVGQDLPPIVVGNLIVPPEIHGMNVLSIGFMIDKDQPLLWRGPMVASVINQLLWEVDWSGNDVMIIDMPPGTGDTYLSILQSVQVDASIIVTTPSELALADVKRGVGVFTPYHVPIAGVVENMATYDWEGREAVLGLLDNIRVEDEASQKAMTRIRRILDTTKAIRIFGSRTQALCSRMGLDLITSIPLDIALQNDNDCGTPYMLQPKKAAIREAFETIAKFIIDRDKNADAAEEK